MMAPSAGFDPQRFLRRFGGDGHNGAVGLQYVDHGPDWVELAIDRDDGAEADDDVRTAAGPVLTLLDMAGTLAVWQRIQRARPAATLDLRIDYLTAVPAAGRLHARLRCRSLDGDLAFVDGCARLAAEAMPFVRCSTSYIFTAG